MKPVLLLLTAFLFPVLMHAQGDVDPQTGQLQLTVIDLTVPAGAIELQVIRSLQPQSDEGGMLGSPWHLNWESVMLKGENFVLMQEGDQLTYFSQISERVFSTNQGEKLEFDPDGGSVRTKSGGLRQTFDANGKLIESYDVNGNKMLYHYNETGLLKDVYGPKESFLKFHYDDKGRVVVIDASTTDKISYVYGQDGLTEVLRNGSSISRYTYNINNRLQSIDDLRSGIVHVDYDNLGRVVSRRWPDGSKEHYGYNDVTREYKYTTPNGEITTIHWSEDRSVEEITDPLGRKVISVFDQQGQILSVKGAGGDETRFVYDPQGRIETMTACCGMTTKYEYVDETALIKSLVYEDGARQDFEYDNRGNLISVMEGGEVIIARQYYPDGLLKSVSGKGIPEIRFTYYPDGYLHTETNFLNNSTEYTYDDRGNLASRTDPGGGTTNWTYDALNRVVSEQDAGGGIFQYEYDENGRMIRQIDPGPEITRYEYDHLGRLIAETDPSGQTTRYYLDHQGMPLNIVDPSGYAWSFEYDANGNIVKEINAAGGTQLYTYDPTGQLAKQVDAAGRTWQYNYSPDGMIEKVTGPGGEITHHDYSPKNIIEAVTDPAGRITRFEHDEDGRITLVRSPNGSVMSKSFDQSGYLIRESDHTGLDLEYEYDQLGQLIENRRSSGYTMYYEYDALGNPTGIRDNLGHKWSMRYDKLGQLTRFNSSTGQIEKYLYDKAGRLVEKTDGLDNTSKFTYTPTGDLASVVEPTNEETRFRYDASGNLSEIQHPNDGVTRLNSDPLGNRLSLIDPLGQISTGQYDKASRIMRTTDANGNVTSYAYDDSGQLSQQRFSDGTVLKYRYSITGELIELDDGQFPVRYSYTNAGQLAQIHYPVINRTLTYSYDDRGLLSKFTDSEGHVIQYDYDDYNRLDAIRASEGGKIQFAYDSKDRLTSVMYANGVKGIREYNGDDQIVQIKYEGPSGHPIAGWQYKYDIVGNLIETISENNQMTRYQYDAADRLKEELGTTETVQYTYLPGGNRDKRQSEKESIAYNYNKSDQLLEAGRETFTYDANGNMITRQAPDGITIYQYDVRNQLVRVLRPDQSEIRFGYSPAGARIWKEDESGRTWFVTDGQNLLAELDINLNPKAIYVHGPGIDQPLVMLRDGEQYYFHARNLGTIALLTDAAGAIAASYDTDAFGVLKTGKDKLNNPFIFTGREYDESLKLYYYRFRYYDPGLGRFLTADPIDGSPEEPNTFNRYVYVTNNPTRFTDPLGLSKPPGFSLAQRLIYWRDTYGISAGQIMNRVRQQHKFDLRLNQVEQVAFPRKYWTIESGPTGLTKYKFNPNPHGTPLLKSAFAKVENELLMSTGPRPGVNIRSPSSILNSVDKNLGRSQTSVWNRYATKLPPNKLNNVSTGNAGSTPPAPAPKLDTWNRASAVLARVKENARQKGASKIVTAKSPVPSIESPQNIVRPPPNPFKIHPGQAAAIAKGTSGVLSVASLLTNYEACIQEGNPPLQCARETMNIMLIAFPAGLLAKAAVTKVLTAIGLSAAAPYVIAGGAMYGMKKAGDRWVEAPVVRQGKQWEKVRKELHSEFPGIVKSFEKEIEILKEEREKVLSEWEESKKSREKIIAEVRKCKDQLIEAEDYLNTLKRAQDNNGQTGTEKDQKMQDLQAMQAQAELLRKQVIDGMASVKILAADIKSEEQAREIIQTHTQCKQKASELVLLAEDAKVIRGRVQDVVKVVSETKETYLYNIYRRIDMSRSVVASEKTKVSFLALRNMITNYEKSRIVLLSRIKMLRRFFPSDIELIREKNEKQNFGILNSMRLRLREIPSLSEIDLNANQGNEIKEYEDCENKTRTVLLEISTLEKEFKDWKGEELVTAIEAAARDALRALAGTDVLLQKAKDYLFNRRYVSKGFNLTVHVQDENSKPVQGAKVNVQLIKEEELIKKQNELRTNILAGKSPKKERAELHDLSPRSKLTDAGGNAEVTLNLSGDIHVAASADGYESAATTLTYNLTSQTVTLTLKSVSFIGWWTGVTHGKEHIKVPVPGLELDEYEDMWTQFYFTSELLTKKEDIGNPGTTFWQWPSMSIHIGGNTMVIKGKNVFDDDLEGLTFPWSDCDRKIALNMTVTLHLKENGQVLEGTWRKDYCKGDPDEYGKEHPVWAEGTIRLEKGIK